MKQKDGGAAAVSGQAIERETADSLAKRINADRVRRRMTWAQYSVWIGIGLSTIYKISRGATRLPHELTLAQINDKINGDASGDAHEVVPGGQRQPERSED